MSFGDAIGSPLERLQSLDQLHRAGAKAATAEELYVTSPSSEVNDVLRKNLDVQQISNFEKESLNAFQGLSILL